MEMQQLSPEGEYANRFQLVSQLADDLAHEIKNPLNSMVINLEVLRSRSRKGDSDAVLDRAAVLETEVMRLNGLVDALLKLLRPDHRDRSEIAIDPLLEELNVLVGVQAKLTRKALQVDLVGDAGITHGRRDAIRFALLNIVSAELQAAGGDEASVHVSGTTGGTGTILRISSVSGPPSSDDDPRAAALQIAQALLAGGGGTVDVEMNGKGIAGRVVVIGLPAATPA